MCEINPRHTKIFRLEFFTSHPLMSEEEFVDLASRICFDLEQKANISGIIRCHIHEVENEQEDSST